MSLASARRLRRNMTDVERKLWARLRNAQLDGYKFRRQHPLGPYVLDFFCESERLVVELDGGQHADDKSKDDLRIAWLVARGCRVIRFGITRSWKISRAYWRDVVLNCPPPLTRALRAHPLPPGEGY